MAALIVAAYLLISQLAEIGFDTIGRESSRPIPHGSSSRFSSLSPRSSGPESLCGELSRRRSPLLPCVVLQSAIKFINLTVPSSAGRIGMNLRFLQQMGVPRAQALAAGAVDDVSETMVQAALLLSRSPLWARASTRANSIGPDTRLLVGIAVALVVSVVAVLAVPKLSDKVVPAVKSALSGVWSVARDRHKRIELFGGNVLSELTYAVALGATCLAYGVHLNLGQLVFVNSSAAILSSVIPSPEASARPKRPSRPVSSQWAWTSRPPSPVQSRSASAPSTCLPSGGTSHCAGSVVTGMSNEAPHRPRT